MSLKCGSPVGFEALMTLPFLSIGRPSLLVTRLSGVAYGRSSVGQPLPSDATALNCMEYGSAEPAGIFQLQPGKFGSTISSVVRFPTPIEVRFQTLSWIGSSWPVARSYAWIASQAVRPSGKPVGKL